MEDWQFHELIVTTVSRFLHRIPVKYVGGFEAELGGGEYALAVENLVLTLVNDKVPVTPAEKEDLRRLVEYLNEPTAALDDLTLTSQP